MSVILEMDGGYPDISSGFISFTNGITGAKVRIKAPDDLKSGAYGLSSITMDPGASGTILPEHLAERLDVERPHGDEEEYYIFGGVGGTSTCFYSPDPIIVGVEDGKEKLEKTIAPFFLVRYAPSITSEGRLLARYQPYAEAILRFISPSFRYRNDYRVEVHSPREKFPAQRRRLKLEVDIGERMDYILIGRDWQEAFQLVFEADRMIIKERWMKKAHG